MRLVLISLALIVYGSSSCVQAAIIAYSNDFDGAVIYTGGVTGGIQAPTVGDSGLHVVEGYAGLGTNPFAGNFLLNTSGPDEPATRQAFATTLTLSGLPAHTSIDLNFLLAVINSWDGNGFLGILYGPDVFNVRVDGTSVFQQVLGNIWGSEAYSPPPGVLLAADASLFYVNSYTDDAYDMGVNPVFDGIPHTADTLVVEFFASGRGWQGSIGDECWAIDNVEVVLNGTQSVPEPTSLFVWLWVGGICCCVALRMRRAIVMHPVPAVSQRGRRTTI